MSTYRARSPERSSASLPPVNAACCWLDADIWCCMCSGMGVSYFKALVQQQQVIHYADLYVHTRRIALQIHAPTSYASNTGQLLGVLHS